MQVKEEIEAKTKQSFIETQAYVSLGLIKKSMFQL